MIHIRWLLAVGVLGSSACVGERQVDEGQRGLTSELRHPPRNVDSYAEIVNRVAPSVVMIRSTRRVRVGRQYPFTMDPSSEQFFGRRASGQARPDDQIQRGLGSGVIVRKDGYCVTNHHVVDGAEEIVVEFADGASYQARLVGSDPPSDLAVLELETSNLKTARIGDSDLVRVGDVAIAIGNPLGVGQTVTAGIISAKGRTTGISDGSFEDFLQTDAPISQGNSGGALVNSAGELIGINSRVLSPSGGNIRIGFAIPVNMLKDVLDQLVKTGRVRRGHLGVTVQTITPDLASALKLKNRDGILVGAVAPGGPADRAGIRSADVIRMVNGQKVDSANRLRNVISSMAPGSQVVVAVVREGDSKELNVEVGEFRPSHFGIENPDLRGSNSGPKLDMAVERLTPNAAVQLGLEQRSGLVVRAVDPTGAAEQAGINIGDVIFEVNRKAVKTASELETLVRSAGDEPIPLLVNRGGRTFFIVVKPG